MNRGVLCGVAAYIMWGVFPIYWKLFDFVPPLETVAHRIIWSFPLLVVLLLLTHQFNTLRGAFSSWRSVGLIALTALLLITNWTVYIWGVNAGRIVETSLGYFMNPLVNVLLGVLFLRERLRPWQWVGIGVAASGVLWLTTQYGSLPWIGLSLAFSFGFYGLFKKLSKLDAIPGLTTEMGVLVIPALFVLGYFFRQPGGMDSVSDSSTLLLLMSTSFFTIGPLLLFGVAARLIPLTVLGLIQYIAPTLQFIIGIFIYHEPFSSQLLVGYILIWLALAL